LRAPIGRARGGDAAGGGARASYSGRHNLFKVVTMAQSSQSLPQPRIVCDDLDALLDVLPPRIRTPLREQNHRADLLEVVMDLGREPEARYPGREVILSSEPVTSDDLMYVIERIGAFGEDNRAGIER